MQLTITEAAKLYGKQRKTLYRHMDAGRLSCSFRGDGHRVIDLSELIRCYGEPPRSPEQTDSSMTHAAPQGDTLTRAMLEELQALRREVEQLRADLRRLPAPDPEVAPPKPSQPEADQPAQVDQSDDPHGLRSLVGALRNQTH